MRLDINQIKEIIPHRHPFLLLDYIEDYEPGQYAVGYKCVTYREEFFAGHFPMEPVMPGVLTVEALAQAGIRLLGGVTGSADDAVRAFLAGTLDYNPDVQCSHHSGGHHEHCGEDRQGCAGSDSCAK